MRLFSLALTAILPVAASPALAATSINVYLTNHAMMGDMPNNLGMAVGGDKANAAMTVLATPTVVPAGEVTFTAYNRSADLVHEMIVLKLADPHAPLPYVSSDFKVNEDAAGHLGEVSELDPGKSGSLTLKLDPGTYMLLCNVPGHYMAGMWTTITVR